MCWSLKLNNFMGFLLILRIDGFLNKKLALQAAWMLAVRACLNRFLVLTKFFK
jgi:hypothetical protein